MTPSPGTATLPSHAAPCSSAANRQAREILNCGSGIEEALHEFATGVADLVPWEPPPAGPGLLLATVAAAHPDAIPPGLAHACAVALERADLSEVAQPGVDEVFQLLELLVSTPAATALPALLGRALRVPDVHPRWSGKAVALLADLVVWRPQALTVQDALDLAQAMPAEHRHAVFHAVVEPLLLAHPRAIDPDALRRAARLPEDVSEARYLAAALADHPATRDATRAAARELSADHLPLRAAWERLGGKRALRVLCIQNIADAQGDEIVRTVPLLQALLDAHAATRVTLITARPYLYGHERLEAVSFDDRETISRALVTPADVIIDFFEPDLRHLNHDADLEDAVSALRDAQPPLLDIRAAKGWNRFHFASVRLRGLEWVAALLLDRPGPGGVYVPALRLIAELGLPLRIGEQTPRSGPVLGGGESPEADAAWQVAIAGNRQRRPVALLNPFGGASAGKGFVAETYPDLAARVAALVDEGYFVVLCLNGRPWGSREATDALIACLPAGCREFVALGPDPAEPGLPVAKGSASTTGLSHAGAVMRQIVGFAARADLVVTVEGWMMHASYLLGRPYRLLMLPESHGREWLPWGRSAGQRIWPFTGDHASGRPPLPEQPRKFVWLRLLDRLYGDDWLELLGTVCRGADSDLRAAAARALGRFDGPEAVAELLRLLGDPSHRVRAQAAGALLDGHGACLGRGEVPAAPLLEAYRRIGAERPDWAAVYRIGQSAEPALLAGLHGDDPVIRREAAVLLERMSRARETGAERSAASRRRRVLA